MASTYLTRTFGSGNQQIFTVSAWVKFSDDDEQNFIFSTGADTENRLLFFRHNSATGSTLKVDGKTTSSQTIEVRTNRAFRDTSAWYHLVLSVDTTQATSSDRVKIYVNGVQETSFAQSTYPSQNYNTEVNKAATHYIGKTNSGSTYYNGSMAHFHFIDGTAYDADTFGETDATTGIWKPKTAPSVTYGTNGFFLKFENSGAFGTDSSGNSNNFTVNGTMTQTIDTPSNVFATWNALNNKISTLSNGNTTTSGTAGDNGATSTLGFSKGKWYWEAKYTTQAGGDPVMGILASSGAAPVADNSSVTSGSGFWGIFNLTSLSAGIQEDGAFTSSYIDSLFANGDIAMFAVDADANKIWYGKNGTWFSSGDPANGTNAISDNLTANETWFPYIEKRNSTSVASVNFGNGFFGTTAVSSAQNPDDGIGIFEYDVPTGYRALCTKSINAEEYS